MFDFNRIYHTGIAVDDLAAAMESYGRDFNLEWAPVQTFDPLPFWSPELGMHEIKVMATYSRQGPQHFELVQGPKGTFYDTSLKPDSRHFGVWVDDIQAEIARLTENGWRVVAAGAAPEDGYGTIAYLEPPHDGLLVELVSIELKPFIDSWING